MSEVLRLWVDADRCCSSGMCESFAPDAVEIDDDGALQVLTPTPPAADAARLRVAVEACPTGALHLE
ncbi:ferredoxin [Nocardioides sp.]|uniref:ferredoxin n=1 Tax=Nocardioides sp. TaxID=35761 RepID=UPI0035175508